MSSVRFRVLGESGVAVSPGLRVSASPFLLLLATGHYFLNYRVQSLAMNGPESMTITHGDGYVAHARYWRPTGTSRGAVLYLHGIQSHGGWFERSAGVLAASGLHVLLPDRRGSGRNQVARGHARSPKRLLHDVAEAIHWLTHRAAIDKVTLVGVSWGGKLALAAAMRQRHQIDNLILVAPGLFPVVEIPFGKRLAIALCYAIFSRRPFDIPLNEPDLFTDNLQKQAFIRQDSLRLHKATARFLGNSRLLDIRNIPAAWRATWPFSITFMLADKDRIIDNERTLQFAAKIACRAMRIIEYRNSGHTLEFQANPSEYLNGLVAATRN